MVRALEFAAIRAFQMRIGADSVVATTHVAFGWCFSVLWDRHDPDPSSRRIPRHFTSPRQSGRKARQSGISVKNERRNIRDFLFAATPCAASPEESYSAAPGMSLFC